MEVKKRFSKKVRLVRRNQSQRSGSKTKKGGWLERLEQSEFGREDSLWISLKHETQTESLFKLDFRERNPADSAFDLLLAVPASHCAEGASTQALQINLKESSCEPAQFGKALTLKIEVLSTDVALDDNSVDFVFLKREGRPLKCKKRVSSEDVSKHLGSRRPRDALPCKSEDNRLPTLKKPPFTLPRRVRHGLQLDLVEEMAFTKKRSVRKDDSQASHQGSADERRRPCNGPVRKLKKAQTELVTFTSSEGVTKVFRCYKDEDVNRFSDKLLPRHLHKANLDHDCDSTDSIIKTSIQAVFKSLKSHLSYFKHPTKKELPPPVEDLESKNWEEMQSSSHPLHLKYKGLVERAKEQREKMFQKLAASGTMAEPDTKSNK